MTDIQLLEHSGGSELDHEDRMLWRVSRLCELCLYPLSLLSAIAGNNQVLWRLSLSEKLHRVLRTGPYVSYFRAVRGSGSAHFTGRAGRVKGF